MKRRLIRICVFLILGAIVNVAVAWGLAVQSPAQVPSDFDDPDAHAWVTRLIDVYELSDNGVLTTTGSRHNVIRTFICPPRSKAGQSAAYFGVQHQRVGWPKLCVQGSKCVYLKSNPWNPFHAPWTGGLSHVEHEWAFGLSSSQTTFDYERTRFLPLLPIWPGFAVNTAFYAAILWGLFAAPFALRRRRRIKRGLCPKCAYDLRAAANDSPVCPECGGTR